MKKTIWIVGFWEFWWFMSKHLNKYFDIYVYSRRDVSEYAKTVWGIQKTLTEVCECDIVIFSVVVQHLEKVVKKCIKLIKPWKLVIDVSSVKKKPTEILKKHLKHTEIIPTHPLFWLKSWANWIEGLNIVICDEWSKYTKDVIKFCKDKLKLNVIEKSVDSHDKEMAYSQWLSHFIWKILTKLDLKQLEQETLMYRKLLDIVDIVSVDSEELFITLETQNPYAKEVREKFLNLAWEIHGKLEKFS